MGAVGFVSVSPPRTDGGNNTVADQQSPEPTGNPTLIAHRGFAGENPENTCAAARAATRTDGSGPRADMVELDVVPTADGDVVVFHDDDLSGRDGTRMGLTDTSGIVWETSTATVTSAKVLQTEETVPKLEDVLESIPNDVDVNIELKNPGSTALRFGEKLTGNALETQQEIWRPFVTRVVDIVETHGHEVLFSSFYEAALAVVSEQSMASVAPILWESIDDGLAIAEAYDADAIHPPVAMIRGTPFFDGSRFGDTDLVRRARNHDRAVNVWTVESWYQADRLIEAGVDGLIADYSTLLPE
ncbi:glycerophosphodiester phosphodiesterase [Halorubrum trueperi]